jgi:hypothetical protein
MRIFHSCKEMRMLALVFSPGSDYSSDMRISNFCKELCSGGDFSSSASVCARPFTPQFRSAQPCLPRWINSARARYISTGTEQEFGAGFERRRSASLGWDDGASEAGALLRLARRATFLLGVDQCDGMWRDGVSPLRVGAACSANCRGPGGTRPGPGSPPPSSC